MNRTLKNRLDKIEQAFRRPEDKEMRDLLYEAIQKHLEALRQYARGIGKDAASRTSGPLAGGAEDETESLHANR